jgi:hypothetical protein
VEAAEQAAGRRLVEGYAQRAAGTNTVTADSVRDGVFVAQYEGVTLYKPEVARDRGRRGALLNRFRRTCGYQ